MMPKTITIYTHANDIHIPSRRLCAGNIGHRPADADEELMLCVYRDVVAAPLPDEAIISFTS
eukprot:scaffold3558_cov100-Skeletonema_menzelii.AAC.1